MNEPRLGFIGFGEAAYHICKGLRLEGIPRIHAFDILADDPSKGGQIRDRANSAGVHLTSTLRELAETSNVVICATSAKFALQIAKEIAPYLHQDHLYADLNAASPKVKQEISSLISQTGGSPVDGAVMDAVPPHGHKVPIFVSGAGAVPFHAFLQPFGMNITVINDQAGSASAIKMVRSIFMKGFTSLLLETLSAAHKSGIEREIIDSISRTFAKQPIEELMNLLLTRTAVHAERRVAEMTDVIETLRESNLDYSMSKATRDTLQQVVDLRLNEYFDSKCPDHFLQVIEAIANQKRKWLSHSENTANGGRIHGSQT